MYRVEWLDAAFDQMDELIRDYPDRRQAFASALQRLSRDLSQWPGDVGESASSGCSSSTTGYSPPSA